MSFNNSMSFVWFCILIIFIIIEMYMPPTELNRIAIILCISIIFLDYFGKSIKEVNKAKNIKNIYGERVKK
jgi:hypothetical protein